MAFGIIAAIAAEVRPMVDIADATAHGITSLLDKLKAVVDGDPTQIGPAIEEARTDVQALISAISAGTAAEQPSTQQAAETQP